MDKQVRMKEVIKVSHVIYFNGPIICMDDANKNCEAIVVETDKIIAVGEYEKLSQQYPKATSVDLKGQTLLPGFIDAHSHIVAVAQSQLMTNLSDAKSVEDVIIKLSTYLSENPLREGAWLLGLGYDQTKFDSKLHPTKFDLDKVSTQIPIFVTHASGHIAATNSKALEQLGYSKTQYEVPEGGVVKTVSSDSKEANGVLEESAFLAPEKRQCIAGPTFEDVLGALVKAQKLYASYGITTCQDASVDKELNQLLGFAAQKQLLTLDVIGYALQPVTLELMDGKTTFDAVYENRYKLLGGKMFLDGSPQGKTAWLTKPYYEVPKGQASDYRGYQVQSDEDVVTYLTHCLSQNIQVNCHCNGDAAIDQFISCYKRARDLTKNETDLRPVMVHAQTVREDQLDEMATLNIIPTFFLDHIWYWGDYHYESVLGEERANRISPAKSALDRNLSFTLHQDSPVVMPNMILAVHNAVNRQTPTGRILGENQRLTVMEALKAVTINGAYQYFEEATKGSLEVGKVADFVIVDKNPLTTSSQQLKEIVVLETIKAGQTIYKNEIL